MGAFFEDVRTAAWEVLGLSEMARDGPEVAVAAISRAHGYHGC